MDIILLICLLFLIPVLFRGNSVLALLALLRVASAICLHLFYLYFLFPETNGLDPVYNDEIYFVSLVKDGVCDFSSFLSNLNTGTGTAQFFGCFLKLASPFVFDVPFFARIFNTFASLLLCAYAASLGRSFKLGERQIFWLQAILMWSPMIVFFSSKVLRDVTIALLTTMICGELIRSRYLSVAILMPFVFVLRKHLAVAMIWTIPFILLPIHPLLALMVSFIALLCLGSIGFPYLSEIPANAIGYLLEFPVNLAGLNFLISDASNFNTSTERVFLQRLISLDTMLPQMAVFIMSIISIRVIGRHKLLSFYFVCNSLYLYFYYRSGFTAARQTILPFFAIVCVAGFSLVSVRPKSIEYSQNKN